MKTIFNTYVTVESHLQADRLKQICLENDLLKCTLSSDFSFYTIWKYFRYDDEKSFFISCGNMDKIKVTESEWLELLKQHQCTE
jgi:hypothetical protein